MPYPAIPCGSLQLLVAPCLLHPSVINGKPKDALQVAPIWLLLGVAASGQHEITGNSGEKREKESEPESESGTTGSKSIRLALCAATANPTDGD